MRIAIVEDIAEERKLLRSRLETQFEKRGIYAELVEFENGEDFLAAAKECSFPILFLDIYMSGENGVEVAKELREFDSDCLLIFTTTSVDHALDGFKVRAMQYLVKPYEEAELTKLIDEILSRIPDFGKYIEIKVDGSNVRVPYAKIVYAEHFSHMMHIHTTNGRELITRQSFESFTVSLKRDQRICDESHPVDIDRLLVVTFTNAAAGEMRERVQAAIAKRVEENPDNTHLRRQEVLAGHAHITTIDSFCLSVLREHFQEIELDPGFRIADEGELKLLRQSKEAMPFLCL